MLSENNSCILITKWSVSSVLLCISIHLILTGELRAQNQVITNQYSINQIQEFVSFQNANKILKYEQGNIDTLTSFPNNLSLASDSYYYIPNNQLSNNRDLSESSLFKNNVADYVMAAYIDGFYLMQSAGLDKVITVRPASFQKDPMIYSVINRKFKGTISIYLEDQTDSETNTAVAKPLQVLMNSDAELNPDEILLETTNFPPLTIDVEASNPKDSVFVNAITQTNIEGEGIWLDVKPALVFETTPGIQLQGWGIETTEIIITIRGTSLQNTIPVTVAAEPGHISTSEVSISPHGTGRFTVRSAGVGPANIKAISPLYDTAELKISYIFPYIFLIFAIAGGLMGGFISFLRDYKSQKKHRLRTHLFGGISWGFIVAVLYFALGINLLDISMDVQSYVNEFSVFGISALGGVGWAAIDLFSKSSIN